MQDEPELADLAKTLDDYFQTELLYKRNTLMAERIMQLLNDNPNKSFFFAFGAGALSEHVERFYYVKPL